MKYYPTRSSTLSMKKQSGYSLAELIIAIMLALFLTAGLLTIFVSSQRATHESLGSGERQENAHFALQLLSRDLKQSYFFAQATGENDDSWNLVNAVIATSDDCVDDANSRSFPFSFAGSFRPLWAASIPANLAGLQMACINDNDTTTSLVPNSDYISIKRVRGFEQSADYSTNRFYLDITAQSLTAYPGGASELGTSVPSAWEYMHHVYYLDSSAGINRLRRLTLHATPSPRMVLDDVLVEGVESMQFMFALDAFDDRTRDGSVHSLVNTANVTANDWDTGRVIGIKIFLLVRALEPTAGYTNNNAYQLGDFLVPASGDNFKRELVSAVLLFQNSVVLK